MTCEVDLTTASIRFHGCESDEAKISAAERQLAMVAGQLNARSGFTNRERRQLKREANILRRWLFPDARTLSRARLQSIANRRYCALSALSGQGWPKPSKRQRREARRNYRDAPPIERRPDYKPPVLTEPERLELINARKRLGNERAQAEKKQAWFKRKYGTGRSQPISRGALRPLK